MSKRELTRTIDVTKCTDKEYDLAVGMFDEAVGKIKKRIAKIIVDRQIREDRTKQREATRVQEKLLAESVALRRQASFTGQSPEAIKAAAEKEKEQKEALERYEQQERETYEKLKQETKQWQSDHPENELESSDSEWEDSE